MVAFYIAYVKQSYYMKVQERLRSFSYFCTNHKIDHKCSNTSCFVAGQLRYCSWSII